MKTAAFLCIFLASLSGCLTTFTTNVDPIEGRDECAEDHLAFPIPAREWSGVEPLEENGMQTIAWYRFRCGDTYREIMGLELQPKEHDHERLALSICGDWGIQFRPCSPRIDFQQTDIAYLSVERAGLFSNSTLAYQVAYQDGTFPGYTQEWLVGSTSLIMQHTLRNQTGTGTVQVNPPILVAGIPGSPLTLGFAHLVQEGTVSWKWENA